MKYQIALELHLLMQWSIRKNVQNDSVKGDIEGAHFMLHLKAHLRLYLGRT